MSIRIKAICRAKVRFPKRQADKLAVWWRMRSYKCSVCHTWHLTSQH